MRTSVIIIVLLAITVIAPLAAQQQTQLELPEYTLEQRWARASSQLAVSWVVAISYAKSVGKTSEQYGDYCAKFFATSWGEPGSGSTKIIRGLRRNYLMFSDSEFEVIEFSEVSTTARFNRPWLKYFGEDQKWFGVTLEEYEACFRVFNQRLAEYLDLEYKEKIKDNWLYLTVTKKK